MGPVVSCSFLMGVFLMSQVTVYNVDALTRRFFFADLIHNFVPSQYKMQECILCLCYQECHSSSFQIDENQLCKDYIDKIICSEVDRCSCCNDLALDIFKPCQHNGQCRNLGHGNFTCDCPSGHYGQRCELNGTTDYCASSPCHHGGTCRNSITGFNCHCTSGWTGHRCETAVPACSNSPCQNRGTCVDSDSGYTCKCSSGWTGTNCDIDLDECKEYGNICKHNGTCLNSAGHFKCNCVDGWTGLVCTKDACYDQQCSSHGVCQHHGTSPFYRCSCSPGYFGHNCEYNFCDVKHCNNGGSCLSLDTQPFFRCQCANGSTGDTCEVALATPIWTQWFYGACSVTCGNGTVVRIRKCSTGHDEDCDGSSMETTTCTEKSC